MTPYRYRSPRHESFRPHRASGKKVQTLSLRFLIAPSSCSPRRPYRDTPQRGRPPNQDERELIVDRQSSQLLPEAATSPMVASSPDGRGAVSSRRSLTVSK